MITRRTIFRLPLLGLLVRKRGALLYLARPASIGSHFMENAIGILLGLMITVNPARAQDPQDDEDLARQTQNPVADLISFPVQKKTLRTSWPLPVLLTMSLSRIFSAAAETNSGRSGMLHMC